MSATASPGVDAGDPWWLPPLVVPPPADGDVDFDPVAGPPEGPDAWLAELTAPQLAEHAASLPPPVREAIGAGFTHRDHRDGPGLGFAAGGPADLMEPGPVLAAYAAQARDDGLDALSDDELAGLLGAARRMASWAAALELAAVTDLDQRRSGARSSRTSEAVSCELAAALTLTSAAADDLLGLSRTLTSLPGAADALGAGRIDLPRARVLARELSHLPAPLAAAVTGEVLPVAGELTTGQLAARLRRLIMAADPAAARDRARHGRADARVQAWPEASGNVALAGRELPEAEVITADQRLTVIARALKAAGAPGTLDQLRAAVFTALLTGRDPATLIPATDPSTEPGLTGLDSSAAGSSPQPDHTSPADPGDRSGAQHRGSGGPDARGPGPGPTAGNGDDTRRDDYPGTGIPAGPGRQPAGLAALSGTVHLTIPVTTWLGLTDIPGDAPGYGPVHPDTARHLTDTLTANPGTNWRLTLTTPAGNPLAHGRARAAPSPPTINTWLAGVPLHWLQAGTPCLHPRATASYQPGPALRNLIIIRNQTCAAPGCRHPATRCDLDHTTPHHGGGITCECNLAPLCRKHHQAKQADGWRLEQPQAGMLVWHLPHGRHYTVRPEPYPV